MRSASVCVDSRLAIGLLEMSEGRFDPSRSRTSKARYVPKTRNPISSKNRRLQDVFFRSRMYLTVAAAFNGFAV
jgi:hypothetical protein